MYIELCLGPAEGLFGSRCSNKHSAPMELRPVRRYSCRSKRLRSAKSTAGTFDIDAWYCLS
jgi:hypothetical protein